MEAVALAGTPGTGHPALGTFRRVAQPKHACGIFEPWRTAFSRKEGWYERIR
jgi:hypothetical protein